MNRTKQPNGQMNIKIIFTFVKGKGRDNMPKGIHSIRTRTIKNCNNLEDAIKKAKRRLNNPDYGYIDHIFLK